MNLFYFLYRIYCHASIPPRHCHRIRGYVEETRSRGDSRYVGLECWLKQDYEASAVETSLPPRQGAGSKNHPRRRTPIRYVFSVIEKFLKQRVTISLHQFFFMRLCISIRGCVAIFKDGQSIHDQQQH